MPDTTLLAGLSAAALTATVLAVAGERGAPAAHRGPMAVLRPADGLAAITTAGGDAWLDDRARQQLVRIDGASGRVVAHRRVRGRLALAAGSGAVWVLQAGGGYGRGL